VLGGLSSEEEESDSESAVRVEVLWSCFFNVYIFPVDTYEEWNSFRNVEKTSDYAVDLYSIAWGDDVYGIYLIRLVVLDVYLDHLSLVA
jgi:hypothetical protein